MVKCCDNAPPLRRLLLEVLLLLWIKGEMLRRSPLWRVWLLLGAVLGLPIKREPL